LRDSSSRTLYPSVKLDWKSRWVASQRVGWQSKFLKGMNLGRRSGTLRILDALKRSTGTLSSYSTSLSQKIARNTHRRKRKGSRWVILMEPRGSTSWRNEPNRGSAKAYVYRGW
jgi:hypothetical protein